MKDRGRSALSARERQRIRKAREAKGLSMQALSKRLGYHRGAVEKVENGDICPSLFFMKQLYKALDLDYIDLRDDDE